MKVNVLTYYSLHPFLKDRILKEQEVIAKKNSRIFVEHILEYMGRINECIRGVTKDEFLRLTQL